MKVLVTGGAGYIDSHTLLEVIKEYNSVRISNFMEKRIEIWI